MVAVMFLIALLVAKSFCLISLLNSTLTQAFIVVKYTRLK